MAARIKDVLSFKGNVVHSVSRDAPVSEVVRCMRINRIGSVVVLDGDELCGIVSEGDILRRVLGERRDPESTGVEDIMTNTLRTIDPETSVHEAMALVTDARCRHLPVVEGGRVVGMVSGGDLTAWMVRELRLEIVDLIGYIHGPASEPPPPYRSTDS
ncbi:MAG TPA: CBS domain-containing protein [Polyangiales bacterium]|jgi:CBS domain-containing protein|nr:CBS domain-containing protein [Polyangiales bacterium]